MRKIIFLILTSIFSFLFFTKDTFAVIYDYDISKFVFKPVSSDKLLNWVPTDMEKFTYKDPYLKTRAIIGPGSITTKAITYLTYYDFTQVKGNYKRAYNFQSIMPFFAIVNPKYLDSKAKIGIPVTVNTQDRYSSYLYLTPDQDGNGNTCLFLETESGKVKEILKNTCFSNFYTQEPFIMIFSVNHYYKFKNQSSVFIEKDYVEQDGHNYTTVEYTLTRRAGKGEGEKEENISLYKTDSVKFDLSEVGWDIIGKPMHLGLKQSNYNSDLCYKEGFEKGCDLVDTKSISDFMRQGGQRFIQFYSYDIDGFPGKPFDSAGGYIYSYDKKTAKANFFQYFPVKQSHLIDQFAPFIVEQVYGEPIKKPDGKLYDFTPGESNSSGSIDENGAFQIPLLDNPVPVAPQCSFLDSFLGLSCLGEWIGYGFQLVKYSVFSLINTLITAVNYIFKFIHFILVTAEKVIDFLKNPIDKIFPKFGFSGYTDTCGNEYTSGSGTLAFTSSGGLQDLTFMQNFANLVSIAVPFAPKNGDTACSFGGQYKVQYKENTKFLDTIFVMISFMVIVFTFANSHKND
ncbi:MAG: hypothetical protein ACTTH6_01335 [Candidatus Altimarinota bacterium]